MELSIEFRDGVLWATVSGRISVAEAVSVYTAVCDAAVEHGEDDSCGCFRCGG
jgi:hypothetical protein